MARMDEQDMGELADQVRRRNAGNMAKAHGLPFWPAVIVAGTVERGLEYQVAFERACNAQDLPMPEVYVCLLTPNGDPVLYARRSHVPPKVRALIGMPASRNGASTQN